LAGKTPPTGRQQKNAAVSEEHLACKLLYKNSENQWNDLNALRLKKTTDFERSKLWILL